MWEENISGKYEEVSNYFIHPLDDNKTSLGFFDTPHLFKIIRNRLESKPH